MPLPSRFQRYDSLIDLLVEQAVCDVLEARDDLRPADPVGEATLRPGRETLQPQATAPAAP